MVGFSSLSGRGTFLNLLQQYFLFRPLPPLPAAVSNCVGKTEEGGGRLVCCTAVQKGEIEEREREREGREKEKTPFPLSTILHFPPLFKP